MIFEARRHPAAAGRLPEKLPNQLSAGTLAILIAVVLVVFGGLFSATRRSDDVSIERQVRVAKHSIDTALDELALQQETVAVWDASAEVMAAEKPDQQWLFDNVGSWLHRIFQHDEAYLIDGRGQAVQVVVDGKRVSAERFRSLHKDFDLLIHSVRGDVRRPGKHDRIPSLPLNPQSAVRTTERASHDTHLMAIGGRPAAASAMLIKPSTPGYVRPRGQWPILISVRYLDGSFMAALESRYLLDKARFAASDRVGPGEHAIELETEWGARLGYLIWEPELPGSWIMATVLPTNLAAVIVLGLLMLLLTRRLGQSLRERSASEARAAHLAFHDPLTGLPNRTLLNERLHEALLPASPERPVVLCLIDLDRFKQVNDTLGHLAGDELIREFSSRLVGIGRDGDTVARLGGDEFAVVLTCTDEASVPQLCQAILELFTAPFDLMSNRVFGGASIGTATTRGAVRDPTELMRRADVALYRAKADGRGCVRHYQPTMDEGAKRRSRLESDLREAMNTGALDLWRQPIVALGGQVVGQELLLRWNHPALGLINPDQIIPLAEETGLIIPIGEWVIEQAARIAAADGEIFHAINLSPVQLRDERFAGRLVELVRAAGVDPALIEVEITEQILLDDSRPIRASIAALRAAGFRIALDDFGTGYSSLSYLRRFDVDKIKIDRSFVCDVQSSAEARAIIAAIVNLGRALGLTVAAEGVETERHAELLIMAGCDQLQGYHFGRPAPSDLVAREMPTVRAA